MADPLRMLVLQHIACEPPGVFEDVLRERGAALRRVELDEGEPLPDWKAFDAIVAMGGPMSTNERRAAWLAEEKRLIGEVRAGRGSEVLHRTKVELTRPRPPLPRSTHPSGLGTLVGQKARPSRLPRRHRAVRQPLSMRSEACLASVGQLQIEAMKLQDSIEREAAEANRASAALRDDLVADALRRAAALVRERRSTLLAANAADVEAAAGLDEGTRDRLLLDESRVESLAVQAEAMAEIEPLQRDGASWKLANGLRVSERRIPIGTVGANFEARPNVALDIAGQLLKSLNTVVLRTGGAALASVTALVDDVLRPALDAAGLPPGAVGLVRSPEREGARILVSLPRRIPLVILRGSGATTAALARLAAEQGVRTLAHAEGGGVLYVHGSAVREKALAIARSSLDRFGVCNRLNLALVDREAVEIVPALLELFVERGLEIRGTVEGRCRSTSRSDTSGRTIPSGWRPSRSPSSTVSRRRCVSRTRKRLGSAAGIVAEDEAAAERFLDGYRGTTAFWHAHAVYRRVRAHRRARDGDRRRLDTRAARAGDVPRSLAAPVPGRGRRHPEPMTSSSSSGRASSPVREARCAGPSFRRRAREIATLCRAGEPVAIVSSGAIALGLPHLGLDRRPRSVSKLQAASALGQARLQRAWETALARHDIHAAQVLLTAADIADRASYVDARNALQRCSRCARCRSSTRTT